MGAIEILYDDEMMTMVTMKHLCSEYWQILLHSLYCTLTFCGTVYSLSAW